MRVLSGSSLASKIGEVCRGDGPRKLAVAFWGPDTPAALFPGGLAQVEIILDVALGGTTKAALRSLGVPEASNVRVCDGLHSKLYIGAAGAVVASANASQNALGRNLEGGRLQELGVWIDAVCDAAAYREAVTEFERLFALSKAATQADVERAPERAGRNVTWSPPAKEPVEFLALVASDPNRFDDTLFIFGDADITEAEHAEKEEVERELEQAGTARDELLEDILVYGDSFNAQIERLASHRFIVMFYWRGNSRTPSLHAYDNVRRLPVGRLGNYHYQGYDSWDRYREVKGLPRFAQDQHAIASQEVALASKLRGPGRRGERWKEYTAFELAEAVAAASE